MGALDGKIQKYKFQARQWVEEDMIKDVNLGLGQGESVNDRRKQALWYRGGQ